MKRKLLTLGIIFTLAIITAVSVNMNCKNISYFDAILSTPEAMASDEINIDFTKDGQCVCKPAPGASSKCENGMRVTFRHVCGPTSDNERPCERYTSECRK